MQAGNMSASNTIKLFLLNFQEYFYNMMQGHSKGRD